MVLLLALLEAELASPVLPADLVAATGSLRTPATERRPALLARISTLTSGGTYDRFAVGEEATSPGDALPDGVLPPVGGEVLLSDCLAGVVWGDLVAAEVRRHDLPIRHCWQHALDHGPAAPGTLVVLVVVGPDGTVLSTGADPRSDPLAPAVTECVLGEFGAMRFAPVPSGTTGWTGRFPLRFRIPS